MARPRRKSQDSPIDNKQKALAEQEAKLRAEIEKRQRFIKDAPLLKEDLEKRRKQDLVIRASQPTRRAESPGSLFDKRYDASVGVMPRSRRNKSLRSEKQAERLKTLALCVGLLLLLWALYHVWPK